MQATRQAPKWVPPLPPGWEAKFDPGQHTYFFINHQTKTTQWEDPRFQQKPRPAPAPSPGPTASAAATSLSQSGRRAGSSSRYESVQLREFGGAARGDHPHSQGESSLTNVEGMVQKLQGEFPAATRELISDMLTSCQNSEARTRQQLKNLGFGVKPSSSSAGHSGSSLSPGASTNRASSPTRRTSRGASPARHEHQQPKSQTSTPKREVSDADRARIINQLKGEFPNSDPNVITIAASTCDFDVDQSRELIKAFQKRESEEERSRGSRGGATSSGHTSSASTQPSQPTQQSLLPAGLSDDTPRPMSSGTSHKGRTSHTRGSATNAHSGGGGDGASRGARGDGARGSQPQHARAAQQVTRMSEHLLNTTSDLLSHLTRGAACCPRDGPKDGDLDQGRSSPRGLGENRPRPKQTRQATAVTSQPSQITPMGHRPQSDSSNRTESVGPNRELRRGPDSSLLMSEYIHAQGPNKQLYSGPDRSRVDGPQGCVGPDVTLMCGPQHDLVSNQQRDRVVTPSGVLVSNI